MLSRTIGRSHSRHRKYSLMPVCREHPPQPAKIYTDYFRIRLKMAFFELFYPFLSVVELSQQIMSLTKSFTLKYLLTTVINAIQMPIMKIT